MSVDTQDWKAEARSLREQGLSEREIAEAVGKAPSTVHQALKDTPVDPTTMPPEGEHFTTSSTAHTAPNGHEPDALERLAGGQPIPGQQTMDGQEVAPVDEIVVTGPAQLSFFNAGGKRPASASLTLTGGKCGLVDGTAFEKGTVVRGTFEAVIFGVGQHDKRDEKTGVVLSCEQRHTARILDLTVA